MSAERKVFGRLQSMAETPPDLIEIQTKSYHDFLQEDVPPQKRENRGLQAIFKEVFPVVSADARYSLDFVSYRLEEPKKSYLQALIDGETYSRPLHAKFRLNDAGEVREEEVFLGDMPMMTPDGAFVINGAERVIVSQLHRSPGISTERQVHANGQPLLSVRIIPDRGNWIEVMFDTNDIMWCFMDQRRRRRKFYATTLLRAFGYGSTLGQDFNATASLMPEPSEMAEWETAWAACGQPVGQHASPAGPQTTVMQNAVVAAAIANGGIAMSPYVVDHILSPEGATISTTEPRILSQAISADTAASLKEAMLEVVTSGTGRAAAVSGVKVAGKTGTAQVSTTTSNSLFIGFAPYDSPTMAISICIEGSEGEDTEGLAASVAGEVIAEVLQIQGAS